MSNNKMSTTQETNESVTQDAAKIASNKAIEASENDVAEAIRNSNEAKAESNVLTQQSIKESGKKVIANNAEATSEEVDSKATEENTVKTLENASADAVEIVSEKEQTQANIEGAGSEVLDSESTDINTKSTFKKLIANETQKNLNTTSHMIDNVGISLKGLGTSFLSLGKSVGLFLLTNPVGWLIDLAAGVALAIHLYDVFNTSVDEANEYMDEWNSKIDEMNSKMKSQQEVVDEVKNSYTKLANGVNTLNNTNINLSDEEYKEFIDLNNKLAEQFPELKTGIDSEGNAIVNLGNNAQEATEKLEKLMDTQKIANSIEVYDNLADTFENVSVQIKDLKNRQNTLLEYKQSLNQEDVDALNSIDINQISLNNYSAIRAEGTKNIKLIEAYTQALQDIFDKKTYSKIWGYQGTGEFDATGTIPIEQFYINTEKLTPEQKKQIETLTKQNLELAISTMNDTVAQNEFEIESNKATYEGYWNSFLQDNILTVMHGRQSYLSGLNDNGKELADALVNGLSVETMEQMDEENPYEYIQSIFSKIDLNKLANDSEISFMDLFNTNLSNDEILDLYNKIQTYFKDKGIDISFTVGENAREIQAEFNKNIDLITTNNGYSSSTSQFYANQLKEYTKDFTTEQKKQWNSVTEGAQNAQEAIELWEKYLEEVAEDIKNSGVINDIFALEDASGNKTKLGEYSEQLDKIQQAYSSLSSAMDTYKKSGAITIDQLQDIISQGDNFLDYLELEDGALTLDKEAMYELAEARLVEMKAQVLQGIVDNVESIYDESSAAEYLASTNYKLAESYTAVAKSKIDAWSADAIANGMDTNTVKKVVDKAYADFDKVDKLFNVTNFMSLDGSGSGSGSGSETDWSDLLDKQIAYLEAKLDNNNIDFNDYLKQRLDLINDFYRQGKIKADEYYKYLQETYENQLSNYDRVVTAVEDLIDEQVEKLNKQKEEIEEYYQKQIDALQEEYDKKKDLMDLEKARYEAERARNQRTKKLYAGGQVIYTPDEAAIRDAEDALDEKELNRQITLLEEQMKKETEAIDEQIDALNEYLKKWQEVSKEYEKQQNKMLASQVLGKDWEKNILDQRLDILEDFKNNYIGIQEQMKQAAEDAAKAAVDAWSPGGSGSKTLADLEKEAEADRERREKEREKFKDQEFWYYGDTHGYDHGQQGHMVKIKTYDIDREKLNSYRIDNIDKEFKTVSEAQAYQRSLINQLLESNNESLKEQATNQAWEYWESKDYPTSMMGEVVYSKYTEYLKELENKYAEEQLLNHQIYQITEDYLIEQAKHTEVMKEIDQATSEAASNILQYNHEQSAHDKAMEEVDRITSDIASQRLQFNNQFSEEQERIKERTREIQERVLEDTSDASSQILKYNNQFAQDNIDFYDKVKEKSDGLNTATDKCTDALNTVAFGFSNFAKVLSLSSQALGYLSSGQSVPQSISNNIKAIKFAKGGIVKDTNDGLLSSIAHSVGEDTMIAVKEGERILTPAQNANYEKLVNLSEKIMPQLANNDIYDSLILKHNVPETNVTNNMQFSIGDIHLHEVNDVDGLSKAIITQLPSKFMQAINK